MGNRIISRTIDLTNRGPDIANKYITEITANNGIRIHPANTENNAIIINSDGMEIFKGGTTEQYSIAKYGDTVRVGKQSSSYTILNSEGMDVYQGGTSVAHYGNTVRVGKQSSGYAVLDSEGMDVYQDGISVSHYGEYTRVGKDGEANTRISPSEVIISAGNNINALKITPDGNTQRAVYQLDIHKEISPGASFTYTHPSAATSNSRVTYHLEAYINGSKTIFVTKGQTTAETTVTTPFKFKYSATTSAITITNNESSIPIILDHVIYSKLTTAPIIEVGGVLALGQDPYTTNTGTVLAVGNGTDSTAFEGNAFTVFNTGRVFVGDSILMFNGSGELTELSTSTLVRGESAYGSPQGFLYEWRSGNATSNSSGLINLSTAFNIDYNNASGITVNCVTSNFKVSGITAWNGAWYGILSPYNSAAVSANTTVNLIVSWFKGTS